MNETQLSVVNSPYEFPGFPLGWSNLLLFLLLDFISNSCSPYATTHGFLLLIEAFFIDTVIRITPNLINLFQ